MTAEVSNLTKDYIDRNKIRIGDYLLGNVAMSMYVGEELKKLKLLFKGKILMLFDTQ